MSDLANHGIPHLVTSLGILCDLNSRTIPMNSFRFGSDFVVNNILDNNQISFHVSWRLLTSGKSYMAQLLMGLFGEGGTGKSRVIKSGRYNSIDKIYGVEGSSDFGAHSRLSAYPRRL